MIRSIRYPAFQRRHFPVGSARRIALAAAVAVVALGGCSNGGSASSHRDNALKQIKLAAKASHDVRTLTENLSVQSSGTSASDLTGTIAIQRKPTTLIGARLHLATGPTQIHLSEIITSDALYIKIPSLVKSTGKPWVKVGFSDLSTRTGINLGSLMQNLQESNPADQTVLFTASKDIHIVGSRTVDGVATTEYAGTYSPEKALKSLSPGLRKQFGVMLRNMGTHLVRFRVWIDGQHVIKKAAYSLNADGQTVTTNILVTSVNQPVNITVPKASQTASLPNT